MSGHAIWPAELLLLTQSRLLRAGGGSLFQLRQQCIPLVPVGFVEALAEPAINRCEEVAGILGIALAMSSACEASGRAWR